MKSSKRDAELKLEQGFYMTAKPIIRTCPMEREY